MAVCRTCELVERRGAGLAPPWDSIWRTPGWDIAHAFGTSIEGWTVLVVRRHILSVGDLTESEARELGPLLSGLSRAVQKATGCAKTYVAQFAEHPQHPHVHFHVIPRADDLPEEHRGPAIFNHLGIEGGNEVGEARMNTISRVIQRELKVMHMHVS